ncbi:MAG: bifunctional 4-hydroxy-2-oxoglutarate aldolase/2-dehydro-3-deoxy-phosphogluconate aldolase [Deltaproteobacteria bacterium]|jgi:2-dehydro-3-deoxyphosphogluconate aldolase/(4S)-4-hydroxy-2-oxoglutarate aldolase|nr:bifunctional 4-hydroxy-2-oxoglutarate aldolase/2-dehydro-3-deoxy-phosphogluconate aldolase [Deltaproteobacteria bacterium]
MAQSIIFQKVKGFGLVPVVAFQDVGQALRTAAAIREARLGVVEITLRTPAGLDSIRAVKDAFPDMTVGAGTVIDLAAAAASLAAGAEFVVLPGYQEDVVRWCLEKSLPVYPGCVTPTEIQSALRLGVKTLKFFPSGVYGGMKAIGALSGPFAPFGVNFIPTGGVGLDNLADYAASPFVTAVGGGFLCPDKYLAAGDYQAVAARASEAVDKWLGFELGRLAGPHGPDAGSFQDQDKDSDGNVMIGTHSVYRAAFYLSRAGFRPAEGQEAPSACGPDPSEAIMVRDGAGCRGDKAGKFSVRLAGRGRNK